MSGGDDAAWCGNGLLCCLCLMADGARGALGGGDDVAGSGEGWTLEGARALGGGGVGVAGGGWRLEMKCEDCRGRGDELALRGDDVVCLRPLAGKAIPPRTRRTRSIVNSF